MTKSPNQKKLTWLRYEEALCLLLDGLRVVVRGLLVHGQRGDLFVGLAAMIAVVRFGVRVNHMVLV